MLLTKLLFLPPVNQITLPTHTNFPHLHPHPANSPTNYSKFHSTTSSHIKHQSIIRVALSSFRQPKLKSEYNHNNNRAMVAHSIIKRRRHRHSLPAITRNYRRKHFFGSVSTHSGNEKITNYLWGIVFFYLKLTGWDDLLRKRLVGLMEIVTFRVYRKQGVQFLTLVGRLLKELGNIHGKQEFWCSTRLSFRMNMLFVLLSIRKLECIMV